MGQSGPVLAVVRSQLRHRLARTLALFLGLLVATTSFAVLTGTTQTSRLVVTGQVAESYRPAYDILVRPAGTTSGVERSQGLVREAYLSGQFGGITWEQYDAVLGLPGVDVAAPVAFLGHVLENVEVPVDLTEHVTAAERQVLRVDVSRVVDAGLSTIPGEFTRYVYLTREELSPSDEQTLFAHGALETVDGEERTVCRLGHRPAPSSTFDPQLRTAVTCGSRSEGSYLLVDAGSFTAHEPGPTLRVSFPRSLPFLIAAVDPAAEARLVGLDQSVTEGRYFADGEGAPVKDGPLAQEMRETGITPKPERSLPVLMASRSFAEGLDRVRVDDLGEAAVEAVLAEPGSSADLVATLSEIPGTQVGQRDLSVEDSFTALGVRRDGYRPESAAAWNLWLASSPSLTATGPRSLAVEPVAHDNAWWDLEGGMRSVHAAAENRDVAFREVTRVVGDSETIYEGEVDADGEPDLPVFPIPWVDVVGRFDPEQVRTGAELAAVPLSLYAPSHLVGGDAEARAALGDGPLPPNGSLVGYAQEPPMMLTTVQALRDIDLAYAYPDLADGAAQAPVGSIRVRVEGAVGIDELSRERVRVIAERIATTTGLEVDIVTGSSPAPVAVTLPAGDFGRPALNLEEAWVQKGVGLDLVEAVDRKSVALFALILLVCALFAVNAVSAAVRERRRELAVLACLGWGRGHLLRSILAEVGLIGLAAGLTGALLAWPLSALAGLQLEWWRPLLAVPAAVLLALLAALVPALRAARSHPGEAVRPIVAGGSGPGSARSVLALSLANLARRPGRTLIAGASLALGVAATCVLLAINQAFAGAATGTVLGDAVTLDVRTVDVVAVVAVVVLGVFTTADALYIGVRERAGELALLRGVGWGEGALGRLVAWEGLVGGTVAALVGAATGLLAVSRFVGQAPEDLVSAAGIAALVGVVVTVLALVVPLAALSRLPTAVLLAEEA